LNALTRFLFIARRDRFFRPPPRYPQKRSFANFYARTKFFCQELSGALADRQRSTKQKKALKKITDIDKPEDFLALVKFDRDSFSPNMIPANGYPKFVGPEFDSDPRLHL